MPSRRTRRSGRRRVRLAVLAAFTVGLLIPSTVAVGAALAPAAGESHGLVTSCAPGLTDPRADANGVISCSGSSTTSSSTSSSTSTSTSSTSTTTTTRPSTAGCGSASRALIGTQAQFDGPVSGTLDASRATWTNVEYPITIEGGPAGACWSGGRAIGTWGASRPWTDYHDQVGAVRWTQPSLTIENAESSGLGDAWKPKGSASNWTLRHVFTDHAYDDCVEDDYLNGGLLTDSLLECYSGFSTRASSGQGGGDMKTITFDHVLMRLEPQTNVYKGSVPGTGGWFKQGSPQPPFALRSSTFRADQPTNHQDLKPPTTIRACSGNVILWGGAGPFPEAAAWKTACPDTVIIEGAAAVAMWDHARAVWLDS